MKSAENEKKRKILIDFWNKEKRLWKLPWLSGLTCFLVFSNWTWSWGKNRTIWFDKLTIKEFLKLTLIDRFAGQNETSFNWTINHFRIHESQFRYWQYNVSTRKIKYTKGKVNNVILSSFLSKSLAIAWRISSTAVAFENP